jgi:hypothetical protein
LIVRDGIETISRALASVRPHLDEVCVYDTGSVDGTLELLDELGAQPGTPLVVERGEWRNDFAWAREQSFAMTAAEWAVWLDADDELIGGQHLAELASADVDGYRFEYDTGTYPNGARAWIDRERLVYRDRFRWVAPLHEHLVPVDRTAELRMPLAPRSKIHVKHHPANANQAAKSKILQAQHDRDLADHGRLSLWTLFWGGSGFYHSGLSVQAREQLTAYLEGVRTGAPLGPETLVPMNHAQWQRLAAQWLGQLGTPMPAPAASNVGRNDPCPCGSGRKYKKCHGA